MWGEQRPIKHVGGIINVVVVVGIIRIGMKIVTSIYVMTKAMQTLH